MPIEITAINDARALIIPNRINANGVELIIQRIVNSMPKLAFINTVFFVEQLNVSVLDDMGIAFKMHGYKNNRFFYKNETGILLSEESIKMPEYIVLKAQYTELNTPCMILAYISSNDY